LEPIATRNGIEIFRGSEKDILDRYLQAADKFGPDFIVNVDGDDIFCDPEYMDKVAETFLKTGADYIECQGLPFGAAPSGVKVEALKKVCRMKSEDNTETGWKRFFTDSGLFQVKIIEAAKDLRQPDIRMSLDYAEDFQFFSEVIRRLYVPGKVFSLREILALLKKHPEIVAINKNRQEEYWATYYKNAAKIKWR
jgi:spore coat polysaccharide biosynthesis protein SpsF